MQTISDQTMSLIAHGDRASHMTTSSDLVSVVVSASIVSANGDSVFKETGSSHTINFNETMGTSLYFSSGTEEPPLIYGSEEFTFDSSSALETVEITTTVIQFSQDAASESVAAMFRFSETTTAISNTDNISTDFELMGFETASGVANVSGTGVKPIKSDASKFSLIGLELTTTSVSPAGLESKGSASVIPNNDKSRSMSLTPTDLEPPNLDQSESFESPTGENATVTVPNNDILQIDYGPIDNTHAVFSSSIELTFVSHTSFLPESVPSDSDTMFVSSSDSTQVPSFNTWSPEILDPFRFFPSMTVPTLLVTDSKPSGSIDSTGNNAWLVGQSGGSQHTSSGTTDTAIFNMVGYSLSPKDTPLTVDRYLQRRHHLQKIRHLQIHHLQRI